MSIDKSLAVKGRLIRSRNVFKRSERVKKILETEGKWGEERSVFGLPKLKSIRLKKKGKAEKGPAKEGAATPEAESSGEGK